MHEHAPDVEATRLKLDERSHFVDGFSDGLVRNFLKNEDAMQCPYLIKNNCTLTPASNLTPLSNEFLDGAVRVPQSRNHVSHRLCVYFSVPAVMIGNVYLV